MTLRRLIVLAWLIPVAFGGAFAHGEELLSAAAAESADSRLIGVEGVQRYRFVSVNVERLGTSVGGGDFEPERVVTITLFPDVRVRAELERVGAGNSAAWLWVGRCTEPRGGSAFFAVSESTISGTVTVGDRVYQIRNDGDRVHVVRELSCAKSEELHSLIFEPGGMTVDRQLFHLLNHERALRGLPKYEWNDALAQAAREHSRDMGRRHFFGHVNPDGQDAGDRMRKAGYEWSAWSENIAAGQRAPIEVLEAWLNSPGHRGNIICNADENDGACLTDVGIGHAQFTNNALRQFWTLKLAVEG